MAQKIKNRINDEYFIATCESSKSMAQAAAKLQIHFNSFKKRAKELNCYNTNESGKGIHKKSGQIIPIEEIIFENKHPEYQTFKLKNRLIKEGYKENKCDECALDGVWNNKSIEMELDHVDGNRTNHLLNNLRMLCPNCHSQTKTFCGKNKTGV
jgi:Zn finger protein HypA/HybF involved in hydrogenase expression